MDRHGLRGAGRGFLPTMPPPLAGLGLKGRTCATWRGNGPCAVGLPMQTPSAIPSRESLLAAADEMSAAFLRPRTIEIAYPKVYR